MKQEDIEQEANDYAYENLWYPGEIFYERDLEKMMKCKETYHKLILIWD